MVKSKIGLINFISDLSADLVEAEEFTEPAHLQKYSYLLMMFGVIMFLLSFLGYAAAVGENFGLIKLWALIVTIVLLCQIVASVAGYYTRAQRPRAIPELFDKSLEAYRKNNDRAINSWHELNQFYQCCGWHNYLDFTSAANTKRRKRWWPLHDDTRIADNLKDYDFSETKLMSRHDADDKENDDAPVAGFEGEVLQSCCKIKHHCKASLTPETSNFRVGCDRIIEKKMSINRFLLIAAAVGSIIQLFMFVCVYCIFHGVCNCGQTGPGKKYSSLFGKFKRVLSAGKVCPLPETCPEKAPNTCPVVCDANIPKVFQNGACTEKEPPCKCGAEACQKKGPECAHRSKCCDLNIPAPTEEPETNKTCCRLEASGSYRKLNSAKIRKAISSIPDKVQDVVKCLVPKKSKSAIDSVVVATPSCNTNTKCILECELKGREIGLICQRDKMLLEQKLHNREQLMWEHEQFNRQQMLRWEKQFMYKAHQMNVEQELHNRDYQIRTDHNETMLERELYQQDQIASKTKQQMLFQRDMMFKCKDKESKQRLKDYEKCIACANKEDKCKPEHSKCRKPCDPFKCDPFEPCEPFKCDPFVSCEPSAPCEGFGICDKHCIYKPNPEGRCKKTLKSILIDDCKNRCRAGSQESGDNFAVTREAELKYPTSIQTDISNNEFHCDFVKPSKNFLSHPDKLNAFEENDVEFKHLVMNFNDM